MSFQSSDEYWIECLITADEGQNIFAPIENVISIAYYVCDGGKLHNCAKNEK